MRHRNVNQNLLNKIILTFAKDIRQISNTDEIKNLKKKLLLIGGIGTAVSVLMLGICWLFISVIGKTQSDFIIIGLILLTITTFMFAPFASILTIGINMLIGNALVGIADTGIKCPKCDSIIKNGVGFCGECGAKINYYKVCSVCGEQNEDDSKCCVSCGNKLK